MVEPPLHPWSEAPFKKYPPSIIITKKDYIYEGGLPNTSWRIQRPLNNVIGAILNVDDANSKVHNTLYFYKYKVVFS